jgi:glycine/D-amino acid oxidase-like deaminating enzyme
MASTIGSHPVAATGVVEQAVDVAVMGGGLTGLLAAVALREALPPGARITVTRSGLLRARGQAGLYAMLHAQKRPCGGA